MLLINEERGISSLKGFPLFHFFTLKSFGNMSPKYGQSRGPQRARMYLQEMGLNPDNIIHLVPTQDSTDEIVIVNSSGPRRRIVKGNALITSDKHAVLSIFPADCYPIFITNRTFSFLALAHGGFVAVKRDRIIERVIQTIHSKVDLHLQDLIIGIGPGIGRESYERNGVKIDLLMMILAQMREVPKKHIFVADNVCTASSKMGNRYLFFSHYRSKNTHEQEGRFGAFISLKEL